MLVPTLAVAQIQWKKAVLDFTVQPEPGIVTGRVTYSLSSEQGWDSIRMDSRGLDIDRVNLGGQPLEFEAGDRYLRIRGPRRKKESAGTQQLEIAFRSQPEKAFYFHGWNDSLPGNEQFWTQGQGKHHSHWFPGFDQSDIKMEFDLTIRVPVDLPVISNGQLIKREVIDGQYSWQFDMEQPMTTYLVAVALGDFDYREGVSGSGIPLRWYFPKGQERRFEPTYRFSVEQFDWLEDYLGIPYPWKKYDQVPVRDFMYGGMENTGATFFNPQYLVDSLAFEDSNYVSTNAHELAHQWFGNLVTETGPEDHWLHEGFATFIGHKAEIRYIGATRGYWELFNSALMLNELAKNGELQALNNAEAGTETFYQKGAWALLILEDLMGEDNMRQTLREFLGMYRFGNARIEDFFQVANKYSPESLKKFESDWVYSEGFPYDQAIDYLSRKSSEIASFLVFDRKPVSPADSENWSRSIREALADREISFEYAAALFNRAIKNGDREVVLTALESPRREVRKAAILGLESIPSEKAEAIWAMRGDPSYLVRERVLWHLWSAGDPYRNQVLDALDNQQGLPNYSLRSLWLALALATEGYRDADKEDFLRELKEYASPLHDFAIREYALEYVQLLGAIDQEVIDYLVEGAVHPYEGFRDQVRALLSELLENPPVRTYLNMNLARYSQRQQRYLETLLR